MHVTRAVLGNLLASSVGRAVGILGPVVLVPLMIHAWGLHTYGEWLILTAVPAYVMLSPDLGLAGAVVNRMAELTAQARTSDAIALYRSAWVVLILASSVFVGIGWIVASQLPWAAFGIKDPAAIRAVPIVGWLCIRILVAQQGFLLSGIYKSARRNARYGLYTSVVAAASLLAGIAAILLGAAPLTVVVSWVATELLFFVLLFVDSQRVLPGFTLSVRGVSWRVVAPYFVPGLGHAAVPLVNALQNQGVLLVLGAVLGPVPVSVFQTTRVLSNGVKSILSLFSSAIMVELAALVGEGRVSIVQRLLVRNAQFGCVVVLCATALMASAGSHIFGIWLKDASIYQPMVVFFLFLSLVPFVPGSTFSVLLLATNKVHHLIVPAVCIALACIGLTAAASAWNGLVGAAVAVLAWEIALACLNAFVLNGTSGLRVHELTDELLNMRSLRADLTRAVSVVGRRIRID